MVNRSSPRVLAAAAGGLLAVPVGGCQVLLAWTEGETGGLGYRIERAHGDVPGLVFVGVGGVGAQVTAFRDESVKADTTYTYRVVAWNGCGDSSPSNEVQVTTQRQQDAGRPGTVSGPAN